MMRRCIFILLLIISPPVIAMDSGFYGIRSPDCSNSFIQLNLESNHFYTFFEIEKGYSLRKNKAEIGDDGAVILNMDSSVYHAEKADEGYYQMYVIRDGKKIPHADQLFVCEKFSESLLTIFNDIRELAEKYPNKSIGITNNDYSIKL